LTHRGLREALCALGNGYFATRGAACFARANDVHYPATYLAGGYNRLTTRIDGHEVENEDLVNLPNWLPLKCRIEGGAWLAPGSAEIAKYRQTLDLREGLLTRWYVFRDGNGRRTAFRERRLVHMREPHLAAIELEVAAENWSGTLELQSALDGRVVNVGVPARGWHGEAYRGHILWDELFIFPLLNWQLPEITRALLMYRYRRLNEARANARAAGYRGAMYPWQSGSSGREETQRLHLNPESGRWLPDHTHLQRHINVAVALNVWRYYQVTRDIEFLSFCGAEMILEIARFWSTSRASTRNAGATRFSA